MREHNPEEEFTFCDHDDYSGPQTYPTPPPGSWKMLPAAERQKLAPLDRAVEAYNKVKRDKRPIWYCRHCACNPTSKTKIISHIKEKYAYLSLPNPYPSIELTLTKL